MPLITESIHKNKESEVESGEFEKKNTKKKEEAEKVSGGSMAETKKFEASGNLTE